MKKSIRFVVISLLVILSIAVFALLKKNKKVKRGEGVLNSRMLKVQIMTFELPQFDVVSIAGIIN